MLYQLIEELVNPIISSIMSRFNMIQDLITTPLKGLVNQVTQGMWKGNGANKFVAEMTDEVIPMLTNIMTGTQNYANSIKKSQEHMLQGFQQASSIANSLFDTFNSIF